MFSLNILFGLLLQQSNQKNMINNPIKMVFKFPESVQKLSKKYFFKYKDRLINVQPLYLKNIFDSNRFWRDHAIKTK